MGVVAAPEVRVVAGVEDTGAAGAAGGIDVAGCVADTVVLEAVDVDVDGACGVELAGLV